MRNWIAGIVATFVSAALPIVAVAQESAAAAEPVETVSMGVVVGFVVVFFGLIAWFFIKVWRDEKKNPSE